MLEFPGAIHIPLAEWADAVINWLLTNWSPFFGIINESVLFILSYIERFLLWLPWWVVVLAVGLIAWRAMRLWWGGLLIALFLVFIGALDYWELTMSMLAIVITAVIISLLLGLPTGILMARVNPVETVLKPLLNAMHKIPSFVYLILALMFFGIGKAPAVIATVIYAAPPVIRLTNFGIRQAPEGVIEAAQAFGSTRAQILFEVQWPLAIPSIVVGIHQSTVMALSMAVIASLIGAGGLGKEVLQAISAMELGRGFTVGLSILLLAIIIDRITYALVERQQRVLTAQA